MISKSVVRSFPAIGKSLSIVPARMKSPPPELPCCFNGTASPASGLCWEESTPGGKRITRRHPRFRKLATHNLEAPAAWFSPKHRKKSQPADIRTTPSFLIVAKRRKFRKPSMGCDADLLAQGVPFMAEFNRAKAKDH